MKMQTFIQENLTANAVVFQKNEVYELISFNNFFSLPKFVHHIEKLSHDALFAHINYLTSIKCDPVGYIECINLQISDVLGQISQMENYLFHKRIEVFDQNDLIVPFHDLPHSLKQKIGSFVAEQQNSLIWLGSKIKNAPQRSTSSQITWLGSKTDLVELANALYEAKIIGSKNGTITKKEFMESFSSFMNIDLSYSPKSLSKAMLRNNPSRFIDQLRQSLNDYINRKIEI
jgi:hypothetical protein